MRQLVLALSIPLLLAACDQNPAPPGSETASQDVARVETPAPAAADPATPLFGRWAADLSNCGTPIVISANRFEGAENICDITELAENADGTFTASLSCTGEGQTISERIEMTPIFGPTGEGIRLNYLDRGGDPVTVFRCKAAAATPAGQ